MDLPEQTMCLSIVIPAYNEADTLPILLPQLIEYCTINGSMIIVVNDGSTDSTGEYLDGFQSHDLVRIFHHKVNRGYGGALKTGLAAVDTEYALTFDADGQHCVENIESIIAAREKYDADMVVGWRKNVNSGDIYRIVGRRIILFIAQILLQVKIHDLNSGFKLYSTRLAQQYLPLCPNSMAFSDIITLIFISEGHLVKEEPIEVQKRLGGKSSINTYTAMETVLEIVNITMLFNPLRFFLPISVIFVLAGVGWGLPIAINGRGVSVGAMMAIVIGVIIFLLGLVAEQLSQLRKGMFARRNMD